MVESALALLVVFNVGMRFAVRAGYRLPLLSAMNACLRLGSRIYYQGRMPGHDAAAPIRPPFAFSRVHRPDEQS